MPGRGERADRQGQHEPQRVPAAKPRARIRDTCQPFPQAAPRLIAASRAGQLHGRDIGQGR